MHHSVTARVYALTFTGLVLAACSSSDPPVDPTAPTPNPSGKEIGEPCAVGQDCKSGLCTDAKCAVPTGNPNGKDPGGECTVGQDCKSGVCTEGKCAEPTPTDGVLNGDETDIDCGGATAPKCARGRGCKAPTDCDTNACVESKCTDPSHTDGTKNGNETGVDCGGPDADSPRCKEGEGCKASDDCLGVCKEDKKCAAPSHTDKKKNLDETDVDCGGATAPKCEADKSCLEHTDCASEGCDDRKKCSISKSCIQERGGRTCGTGEFGDAAAQHESCCTTVRTSGGPDANAPFTVDKYQITAARMRAFIERVGGNVQAWVAANRAKMGPNWQAAWEDWLPAAEGTAYVGGGGKLTPNVNNFGWIHALTGGVYEDSPANQGCWGHRDWKDPAAPGGLAHATYYVPPATLAANLGDPGVRKLTKEQLDERPQNCTNYLMFAAFCAWDGGRVISREEHDWLYNGNPANPTAAGSPAYPWGATPAPTTGANSNLLANWSTNYFYPEPPAAEVNNQRYYSVGDSAYYISPPGRFGLPRAAANNWPGGASRPVGPNGERVQDIIGNMMETTRTVASTGNVTLTFGDADAGNDRIIANTPRHRWSRNGSFEGHGPGGGGFSFSVFSKYGKMTSRCVR